jgi:hypothetical protein
VNYHVALLGDSVLDNRSYTEADPDIVEHLRRLLPAPWTTSLLAQDGTTTNDFAAQLQAVSDDVSHLVISLGGNDCILASDLLHSAVRSTGEALELIADRVGQFESGYREAIGHALELGRTTAVCTVYNGNLPPNEAKRARVGLTPFNDAILRVAFEHRLTVIDLRLLLRDPEDYANPIEPSGTGGAKIARAIHQWIQTRPGSRGSDVIATLPNAGG